MLNRFIKLWLPAGLTVAAFIVLIAFLVEYHSIQLPTAVRDNFMATAFLSEKQKMQFPKANSTSIMPYIDDSSKNFEMFTSVIKEKKGKYSIYIQNLNNNKGYAYNAEDIYYAASLYKVPIAVSALMYLRDTHKTLEDKTTLMYSDFSSGTGVLTKYRAGTPLTYREIINVLLSESDNTAQSLLLRVIPQNYLVKGFSLNNTYDFNSEFLPENKTNSRLYAQYLLNVYNGNILSQSDKDFVFKSMEKTSFDDRLTPYFRPNSTFAHKIGNWGDTNNWHDCGIVKNGQSLFSVCVMSNQAQFETFKEVTQATAEFINSLML